MRIVMFLAAIFVLWIQPAKAVVVLNFGPGFSIPATYLPPPVEFAPGYTIEASQNEFAYAGANSVSIGWAYDSGWVDVSISFPRAFHAVSADVEVYPGSRACLISLCTTNSGTLQFILPTEVITSLSMRVGPIGDGNGGVGVFRNITLYSLSEPPSGIPEPSSWILMILGIGGVGAALRRGPRICALSRA